MEKTDKRLLNLGCGHHYSTDPAWTNLDFESTGAGVIGHNLLQGIPFEDNTFDVVYHSHVLEHFSRESGRVFLAECFRVLKPGGIIRIAIPDLEGIVRNYLYFLESGMASPGDMNIRANYEWMLLEMYDQTVRNKPGGQMGEFLAQENILNEDFVFGRIGEEGRAFRRMTRVVPTQTAKPISGGWASSLKSGVRQILLKILGITDEQAGIGRFRTRGEIHQWMYDRYSLTNLLVELGAVSVRVCDANASNISNWVDYGLDTKDGLVRKPDSLFMEAKKA